MLSGLILIGRGLDRKGKRAWKKKNYCLVLSVLKTLDKKNLVMIAWWTHLYPFRTQKLSIIAAKIVHCAKIARCQFLLFFTFLYDPWQVILLWYGFFSMYLIIDIKYSIFYWLFHLEVTCFNNYPFMNDYFY